ncbi:hypothetical protein M409DRAFT_69855 [Zasmidium cellare ATCC 36951]|uniref:Velvet domain-containing protein n=1 Tax=Zasmidium cellare ATCC 36951 TaxID=1080233 RepID=A0A6A6C655_ZASCE|nr:uncharacterized protein M409DRAFT_69855 [Zasmidium cellare ATCC 36951]KAF2161229.1 hypothetical protein M409DRAFT_69855 [Zasmidium cellare ATCC 36951]
MTVLQQPQRARACGQGAKSSADRRPVDPPPIVELKIFQGEKAEEDITFTMHGNYFLFATLESARSMAHGRVPQERQTPPVLTGTPVAGMVYLDRPSPAGYFIFPDLSVRHEGRYRLSFSLFEELKQPKDHDKTEDVGQPNAADDSSHVTHRLEVKSEPFHVYSAKKFPGLSESTSLSRMVAEQGCRVRIRRDVRMRRRDHKSDGKDWDDYEEETAAARARASNTPDPNVYPVMQTSHGFMEPVPRPRSASNASHHSAGTSISRRPSLQEMGQAFNPPSSHYGTAPHTPQNGYAQTSYGPSPGQQYQQNQYTQPQAPMQPPPPQYQHQSYAAPPPVQPPAQQNYYSNYQPAPAPAANHRYSAPNGSYEPVSQAPRQSIDYSNTDYRRHSTQDTPPPVAAPQVGYAQHAPHTYQPPTYPQPPSQPPSQHSQHSYSSMQPYANRPAPPEPVHPPAQTTGSTPSQSGTRWDLPPLNTTLGIGDKIEASSPSSTGPQNSYYGNAQTPYDTHKRSYGNVFSDRHQNGPLRQGARPNTYGHAESITSIPSLSAADDDDNTGGELDPSSMGMQYRRADGREIQRALPGHNA